MFGNMCFCDIYLLVNTERYPLRNPPWKMGDIDDDARHMKFGVAWNTSNFNEMGIV